ncbi:protein mono-ADP-ribosyltransferase PARP9-like [Neolamprologus brichardi]|uniref:protein mono-ADP-ribosyltransferase PARP9-like n=1 Tax=Neolamprologus brichardi TaxID=32507 RepID=UPI0003EBCA00|nr:protein mono-ADP-ribosyltransferase PARP9-like [Neolamprologus brichardi]
MASKLDIRLQGSSLNIVRQCGHVLTNILYSKFGCVAIIEGMDFESDMSFVQQKRQSVAQEKRFSVKLPAGIEVSVWKADLTTLKVDAVVNAANCHLQHAGGLAYALCEAGGPQIQKESDIHITTHGALKTGEAVITTSGSLPCNVIIHAVGPRLSYGFTQSEFFDAKVLLEKTICRILQRVEENCLDTVAIPAISSGLFNYPLQDCADTIVSTVKHYYERVHSLNHLPKEILFANNDDQTVTEMMKACNKILAPHQLMPHSLAAQSKGTAKTSDIATQIWSVNLTLKRDNIENQKVDVIVNTASPDKDLTKGQISAALLNKAGRKMQHEIRSAPQRNHIIITQGYNLWCKEVFHTFCVAKERQASQEVLFDSVLQCLKMAATNGHKSIAFPAIGSGNLGFNKREVAHIMSDAVVEFAKMFTGKMEIYFVIFPSDSVTFQAFEDKIRSFQQKAPHSSFTPALMEKEDLSFNRGPAPHISLSAPSEESASEAEKWLTHLLYKSSPCVTICNNFIQHLSEKQYLQLSRLTRKGVKFEEFLTKGHTCLKVDGDSVEDAVVAALQVEAMLCIVQKEFVTEEENEMCKLLANEVPLKREKKTKTVDNSSWDFKDRIPAFRNLGLWILKVDKVENPALELLFDLKKKQLGCSSSEKMFQRIPAQFCEMVSQIGFHAECAPPEDPQCGEGIYFAKNVKKAMEVWRENNDQYLYFVEADVLTGKSIKGKPGLILPPAVGKDPQVRFDSVNGGSDISVIFSSYQALPRYIITCRNPKKLTEGYL